MNKLFYNHPYHIVTLRPWPILLSFNLINLLTGIIQIFHKYSFLLLHIRLLIQTLILFQWWRDVTRERTFQGIHTLEVTSLIRLGILLFITSEIFFFFSFFWAYFHISLSPNIEIGLIWPPLNFYTFNPYRTPLLNTIILLSSGISITWGHYRIISKKFSNTKIAIKWTIFLGIYFSLLQWEEYNKSFFTISDSSFGTIFFIITGFHGLHVIIGTIFIIIINQRLIKSHFSPSHHFGFEASAWYWHFVDVIWLFVYIFLYWWIYYLNIIMSKFNFQLNSLFSFSLNNFFNYYNNFYISNNKFNFNNFKYHNF